MSTTNANAVKRIMVVAVVLDPSKMSTVRSDASNAFSSLLITFGGFLASVFHDLDIISYLG